jgi:hypothetical protein
VRDEKTGMAQTFMAQSFMASTFMASATVKAAILAFYPISSAYVQSENQRL